MELVPGEPVNSTMVLFDIAGFSKRDNQQQLVLRRRLNSVASELLVAADVAADREYREDRGDGLIVLVSGGVPKTTLLRKLMSTVPDLLRADNSGASDSMRMRLRMVLAAGEVVLDHVHGTVGGVVGHDLNQACRLLDASFLREALQERDTDCVLSVSKSVYEGVVLHRYQELRPEEFERVVATVKQDRIEGWLYRPAARAIPAAEPFRDLRSASRPRSTPLSLSARRRASRNGAARRRAPRWARLTTAIPVGVLAITGAIASLHGSHDPAPHRTADPPHYFASRPAVTSAAKPPFQATPDPSSPPGGSVLIYSEQFRDSSLWTDDGHHVGASYTDESYLVYSARANVRTYTIGYPKNVRALYPQAPDNVGIDVWGRLDADATNGYGAVCRAGTDGAGYYFTIWGTTASIERKTSGAARWVSLEAVPDSAAINKVGANHFQVACINVGADAVRLSFRINGTAVATATDTGSAVLQHGTIALTAGSDRSTTTVGTAEFSSIKVLEY